MHVTKQEIASWRSGRQSLWLLLFAVSVMVTSSGCVLALAGAAAAGAGAVAYAKADVEQTYPYPMDIVWDTTLMALAESELQAVPQARDQISGHIDALTATGDKIKIVLASQGSATKLSLRVNTFGNKEISTAVLQRIGWHLEHDQLAELPPLEAPPHVLPPQPEVVFPAQ